MNSDKYFKSIILFSKKMYQMILDSVELLHDTLLDEHDKVLLFLHQLE
jgi:hypothetical protein